MTTTEAPRHFSGKAMMFGLLLTATLDVGVAIVAFNIARQQGVNDQGAFLISGIGPLTMMALTWIRARALSGASVVILVFLVLSSLAAFIGGADSRLLIVKDSVITAGFGLACLVSVLFPRPLMFYFGAKFATDGTKAGLAYWNGLWRYPDFRKSQYVVNAMWGIAYLVEAGLRIAIAYTVDDFDLAYTITNILPFVFLAGLIGATITIGHRTRTAALTKLRHRTAM